MRWVLVALLAAAAGCKKEKKPPPAPPTPVATPRPIDAAPPDAAPAPPLPAAEDPPDAAPEPDALAAVARGAAVELVAIAGDKPRVLGSHPMGAKVIDIEWTSADAVAVLLATGAVHSVARKGVQPFAMPPADAWNSGPGSARLAEIESDRRDVEDRLRRGEKLEGDHAALRDSKAYPHKASLVRLGDGEVRVAHCAVFEEDGDQDFCTAWVWARLDGAALTVGAVEELGDVDPTGRAAVEPEVTLPAGLGGADAIVRVRP